jgi:hypothetical protein
MDHTTCKFPPLTCSRTYPASSTGFKTLRFVIQFTSSLVFAETEYQPSRHQTKMSSERQFNVAIIGYG